MSSSLALIQHGEARSRNLVLVLWSRPTRWTDTSRPSLWHRWRQKGTTTPLESLVPYRANTVRLFSTRFVPSTSQDSFDDSGPSLRWCNTRCWKLYKKCFLYRAPNRVAWDFYPPAPTPSAVAKKLWRDTFSPTALWIRNSGEAGSPLDGLLPKSLFACSEPLKGILSWATTPWFIDW